MAVVFSPEAELLLYCARPRRDTTITMRIKALLHENLDWKYLFRTAMLHGIMPLLYRRINATFPNAVPKSSLVLLKDSFYTNVRYNLYLVKELLRILDLFEAHGISAIPFKGPILGLFVYSSLAYRQFGDLDVLVHKKNVLRAKSLMLSLGYRPEFQLTHAQEVAYVQTHCEYNFNHNEHGIHVEIHWQIVPELLSSSFDIEKMFQRLRSISFGSRVAPTLSPGDLMLILCVHGAFHQWKRLLWICDIAELINTCKEMDWERVMKEACAMDCVRLVSLGLNLASDLLDAEPPQKVLQKVQADPVIKSLTLQVEERLFDYTKKQTKIFTELIFNLKLKEHMRGRARYCFYRAFTPNIRDIKCLPLPPSVFVLYYILRPIRLAGEYVLRAWRWLRGQEKARGNKV